MTRHSQTKARFIVFAFVFQVLIGVLVGHYLMQQDVTVLSVTLMVLTAIFIGTRLRGINNIVHECSHSTFAEDRADNVFLGKFCVSLLLGCFRKYRDDHLSHHAHLGDYENDKELAAIEKLRLHDPLTAKTILRHFITPLTGRHLSMYTGINLSREDGLGFYLMKIGLIAGMFLFLLVEPATAFFFVFMPWFYVFPTINFWTDCIDHAGLVGEQDALAASRNVLASTPVQVLFFPRHDCYHLVHHLFPQVPAQHLKDAHEQLCEDPDYANQPLAVRPVRLTPTSLKPRATT
ncbi:fatty acid desaturase family protein [Roseivivax lentus]|nr:fatty acid desaturase [Roseivivax lentus]